MQQVALSCAAGYSFVCGRLFICAAGFSKPAKFVEICVVVLRNYFTRNRFYLLTNASSHQKRTA